MSKVYETPVKIELSQFPATETPASTQVDLSDLLNVEGSKTNSDTWIRLLIQCFEREEPGSNRSIPIQFTPTFGSQTGLLGELSWLVGRNKGGLDRRLSIIAEAEEVDFSTTVSDLPKVHSRSFPRIQVIPGVGDTVSMTVDGKEVLGYCFSPSFPKPFFYPVIGPSGRHLTRRSHPRDHDGRSHFHHRSLWIEYLDINRYSFETEDLELVQSGGEGGENISGIGRIEHRHFLFQRDGPIYGSMAMELKWLDEKRAALLREVREVRLYNLTGQERLLDLSLNLRAEQDVVTFHPTSFGIMAVRVANWLEVGHGEGRVENSEGKFNERGAHRQRAYWCDYSGPVTESEWNGIAIFDHPDNPNYPTYWHVRDDGWMCAAPFYIRGMTLQKGESIKLQYRLLLHRGDAREGRVDAHHHEYVSPPKVHLGKPEVLKGF